MVQPEPTPPCNRPHAKHIEAGSNIQKEKLFRPGHIGHPHHKGNKPVSKSTNKHRHNEKENHNNSMSCDNYIIGVSVHSTSPKTSKLHAKHAAKTRTSNPKT